MAGRNCESGIVLVNVLAVLALASSVVLIMVAYQDSALFRSQRFAEAAQALAVAEGGELSAVAALRRDAETAGEADHRGESWTTIEETDAAIEGGRFTLRIRDAQARYNLNSMLRGGSAGVFPRIAEAAGFERAEAMRIELGIRALGGLDALSNLSVLGVNPEAQDRLVPYVTVLPVSTRINLNTASEALLAALFDDPLAAKLLVAKRDRQGFVTHEDVRSFRAVAPFGSGYSSDFFVVTTEARIGGTAQTLESLIDRRGGDVRVISRERRSGGTLSDAAAAN